MNRPFLKTTLWLPLRVAFVFVFLLTAVAVRAEVGDIFTATVSGVQMTFKVISDTEVQVGNNTNTCILKTTSGSISVPVQVDSEEHYKSFKVTKVGDYAFYNCSSLTSLSLPSTVTEIGSYALGYCRRLTSLTLPSSLKKLDFCALNGCVGITSLAIPASLTSTDYSFAGMTGLTKFTVYAANPYYSAVDGVLYRTGNGVKTLVAYPAGKSGSSFNVPSDVTALAAGSFQSSKLSSVTLPDGLTSIGAEAFRESRNLTSITIPVGVTSLNVASPFYLCTSLKTVTLLNGNIASNYNKYLFSDIASDATLRVPEEYLDLYQYAPWLDWFTNIVVNKITYDLWVGGTQVTNVNQDNVLGDGKVSYNPGTNTLTLNNATVSIDEYSGFGIYNRIDDLVVEVKGTNLIESKQWIAFCTINSVHFQGSGTLQLKGKSWGLSVDSSYSTITLSGGVHLICEGGENGLEGHCQNMDSGWDTTLKLYGVNTILEAEGAGGSIVDIKELKLNDGLTFTTPSRASFSETKHAVCDTNGIIITDRVVISIPHGIATGIDQVDSSKNKVQSEEWYSLDGQRVVYPQKGHIYIRNGEKTVHR